MDSQDGRRDGIFWSLMAVCAAGLVWSGLGAPDKATWAFEVLPLTAVVAVFVIRRRWFCFTNLSYALLTWFFLIQCLGGRYTFAEAPFPESLIELFGLERNPVDRLGHFFQGFVPAILLREWLIRRRGMVPRWHRLLAGHRLLPRLQRRLRAPRDVPCVLLFYPGRGAGMARPCRAIHWDAQWDMTMAVSGAVVAQLLLGRLHDRWIAQASRAG